MDIKAFFDDLKKRFMKSSAKGPADPNDDGLGQYDEAGAFPTDKENEAQNAEPMASDDGPANTKQTLVAKANGAINQIKQTTRDLLQRFLKKKDQADVAGDVGEDHAEDTAQDVGPEGAGGITEDPTEADVGEGPEDETDKTDKTEEATVDQGAARDEDDKVSAPGVGEGEGPPPDQATSDTASDAGEISAEADTVVDQDAAGETEESTKTLIDKTKAVLAQVKNSRKHQIILIAGAIIFMAIINFPEEEE